MSKYPKLTHFVSEIDQLLQQVDKKHVTLSLSQQKERDKHLAVFKSRDRADIAEKPAKTWENF